MRYEDNPGELEPGFAMLSSDLYAATLSAHRKKGTRLSLLVQNMNEDDILALIEYPPVIPVKVLAGDVGIFLRSADVFMPGELFRRVQVPRFV